MTPKEYKEMMAYLTRPGVRKQVKFASDLARQDMSIGGFITKLYRGVKGLQEGRIEKELINKYRSQGMDLLEAINKANPEAAEIVKNRKLKVIQNKLNETNMRTDDYVKLIDEEIKLNDPELFRDIRQFEKNNRSDLADKMRALRHPDWAAANFGENYEDVLQQRQNRALKQMMDDIDPNVKERTIVDDIDDMNQANIDEFFGRKKNADGGRIGFDDGGMLVQPDFGEMREGFKKNYDIKELDKATEYYTKGEFKKFSDIKGFGQGRDPAFIKKYRNMRTLIKKQLDYHDGKFKIPDKTDIKKTDQTKKLEKYLEGKKTIKQSEFIKKLTELGYKDPKKTVNNLAFTKNLNIIRDVERAPQPKRGSKIYTKAQLNKAAKGMFEGKTYDQLSQKEQIKVRGKLFQQGGKYSKFRKINNPLSKELIKDIKTKFGNVYKDWDFDNYRFGVTGAKGENSKLYDKIKRFVAEPKPYELTADLSSTDGWLGSQMNRAYKLGDERYVPIKVVRNNKEKIAGFIDNTEFGGGKKYMFADQFIKGSNADGVLMSSHPDFKETKKYRDIANIAKLPVRGALKNILNSKGVDTSRISLSDLYKYMMDEVGVEGTKNAIEQHHVKGVGVRATGDYQLLNRDLNALARQISSEISEGNLSRVNELKQKGIRVNVGGQEFGAPQRTASADFLKIKDDLTKFYKDADLTQVRGLAAYMKENFKDEIVCNLSKGVNCNDPRAYQKSINQLTQKAKQGDEAARATLTKFTNKAATAGRFIKGALGPLAIASELAIEGGIALNKTLQTGVPLKTAFADSIFNLALGPKLQIDKEAELKKEFAKGEDFAMAERGRRMMIPQSATADAQRLKKREEERKALFPDLQFANPSNQEIDEILKEQGVFSPFTAGFGMQQTQPGIGDMRYNEDLAYDQIRDVINKNIDERIRSQQMQNIATAGGIANLAGGGIAKLAGVDSGPPPESGPNSQGLQGLMKRVRNI